MKQYYCFARSERGANHKKINKICQDASGKDSFGNACVIAVADGHGSDDYIRTDRGSKFAVEVTLKALRSMVEGYIKEGDLLESNTEQKLTDVIANILKEWHAKVEKDLEADPIREVELEKVSEKYRERYQMDEYKVQAYGTTLIAVCMTENFWFGLQIGDGRCVRIRTNGQVDEPIPWDDECEMNITTSLCDSNAMEKFRYAYDKELPAAIFIGSDGVDDSYCSDEDLHGLYEGIFQIFIEHGELIGRGEVEEYLPELTRRGSGDDVSIAGIIDSAISEDVLGKIKHRKELDKQISDLEDEIKKEQERFQNLEADIKNIQKELERCQKMRNGMLSEIMKAEETLQEKKAERSRMETDAESEIAEESDPEMLTEVCETEVVNDPVTTADADIQEEAEGPNPILEEPQTEMQEEHGADDITEVSEEVPGSAE